MKILNRYTNEIIYEDGAETMRETVAKAVASGANLRDADLSDAKFSIPFTPDPQLINKVARAALATNDALEMDAWHTCETTHCIAGWSIHLHPEGKLLEHFTSPYLAARFLLGDEAASHFDDSNDAAREWLKQFLPT